MKKSFLLLACLIVAVPLYGQIVYKTDFEVAIARTGVVYSVSSQDVGEFSYVLPVTNIGDNRKPKAKLRLDTFEDANTNERVQRLFMIFGGYGISLNCSEIGDIIMAITQIKNNHNLRYIARTANLRLKWGSTMMEVDVPADGSVPGDFLFSAIGYVSPDEMIKILEEAKAIAD